MPFQIDQDVDAVLGDAPRRGAKAQPGYIDEGVASGHDAAPVFAVVERAVGIAGHFEQGLVMRGEKAHGEMRRSMIVEIRRQIADAQFPASGPAGAQGRIERRVGGTYARRMQIGHRAVHCPAERQQRCGVGRQARRPCGCG